MKIKNADKVSGRKNQDSMPKDRRTTCQTYPCLTRNTYITTVFKNSLKFRYVTPF